MGNHEGTTRIKLARRTAHFDLSAIPNPKACLEERLGPLAGYETEGVIAANAAQPPALPIVKCTIRHSYGRSGGQNVIATIETIAVDETTIIGRVAVTRPMGIQSFTVPPLRPMLRLLLQPQASPAA